MAEQRAANIILTEQALRALHTVFRGEVIGPNDPGYDAARRVWNGMIDRCPALIVRCTGVADVISAVDFARNNDLLVAVRGGGHNVAGNATCDGGIVIDLSRMKGMRVDPVTRTARAQPGLTWGEFDHETQAFGLATTGGLVSSTGIAGFTLGGGIGWLTRKYGFACDNLLSADVVTADGRFLTASAIENADLLWGLRGGGGNFGIVTSFEYQLHPVGQVLAGALLYPIAGARDLLRFYREYVATIPDELTSIVTFLRASPESFIPTRLHNTAMIGITLCYAGDIEEGQQVVRPLREFGPPIVDAVGPMPYETVMTMLGGLPEAGLQNYWKAEYLNGLSDGAIDTIIAHTAGVPSPLSEVEMRHLQGAVSRVRVDEAAFSHRGAEYIINIVGRWADPKDNEAGIGWATGLWEAVQPFSAGGTYVNFMSDEGADRVRAAYGPNYERLVALKNKYDPTNFFRLNQNIKPTIAQSSR